MHDARSLWFTCISSACDCLQYLYGCPNSYKKCPLSGFLFTNKLLITTWYRVLPYMVIPEDI